MKKIIILCIGTILTIACSNPQKAEIEQAAQGYLDAMGNYRIDDAAPYATRHTRENAIPTLNKIMARSDTAYINSNRPAVITIHKTRMLSDTSARVYYHKSTPIKEVDDSVTVLLEENRWLVDVRLAPIPFLDMTTDSLRPRPEHFTRVETPDSLRSR